MTEPMPASPVGVRQHLIDTSVYARASHPAVAPIFADAIRRDMLLSCGPFILEAVISARDREEATEVLEDLHVGLPYVQVTEQTWQLAYRAQQAMAEVGPNFHRRPPADYLIASAAHEHGVRVLHYDHAYDAIVEYSALDFVATWVAPAGTLEAPGEQPQVVRQLKRAINTRLAHFKGDADEEDLHHRLLCLLDHEMRSAGKPLLPSAQLPAGGRARPENL